MNTLSAQQPSESSPSSTLTDQFRTAAASARSSNAVHDIIRQVWRANAEGLVTDEDAQRIAEAAGARRAALATRTAFAAAPPARPKPKLEPRSPDHEKSLERARKWAFGRHVPADVAAHFSLKENAALAFVCFKIRANQSCTTFIGKIAGIAGVCRTTVKNMQRKAEQLGILDINERRIPGRKSDTNVIRPRSLELMSWLNWIPIGGKKAPSTRNPRKTPRASLPQTAPKAPQITLPKPWDQLSKAEKVWAIRQLIPWEVT